MLASRKASLRFTYEVFFDETLRGSADFISAEGVRTPREELPVQRPVTRHEWLSFVLDTIKAETGAETVTVNPVRRGADGKALPARTYTLDERTVKKIKTGELLLADLIL